MNTLVSSNVILRKRVPGLYVYGEVVPPEVVGDIPPVRGVEDQHVRPVSGCEPPDLAIKIEHVGCIGGAG
jgi:hypothetical protein